MRERRWKSIEGERKPSMVPVISDITAVYDGVSFVLVSLA
jgi:hypothetical protein